jgi:hypothetical protein
MATEVFINIKDLPEITQISNGDYVLLETANGTKIVDFKNFVLPEANTLVSNRLSLAENQLSSFSTTFNTKYDSIIAENAFINANFQTLCARITNSTLEYFGTAEITIEANNNQASQLLNPVPSFGILSNISLSDIIIFPLNAYAAKYPAYVTSLNKSNGLVTIKGSFYKTKFTYNNTQNIGLNSTATGSLCGYSATNYASSLAIDNTELISFLNAATVTTESIQAEESAIYGIAIIKTTFSS